MRKTALNGAYLFSLPTSTKAVKKQTRKLMLQMYEKAYRNSVQVIIISFLSSETPVE